MAEFPYWFLYILAGILGAILGSFANVCIVRMPKNESIVRPRSRCTSCGHTLKWRENIPVFSFIFLAGKCSQCKARISIQYPLVEIICVILSLLTWWHFGNPYRYLAYFCMLVVPLVIVTFIDLKWRVIPDEISIPGIFAGLFIHVLFAGHGRYYSAAIDSIAGALAGGVLLFLVAFLYEKIKKQEGLGGGDVKLIAMLGAFFGWQASIFILLVSSVLGSIVGIALVVALKKDMKYAIPFGPFLAIAGLVHLFIGPNLLHWYINLFI